MITELSDESYARAALTYLVEPADPQVGPLLQQYGAVETLQAIKAGMLPGVAANDPAVVETVRKWQAHLPEVPSQKKMGDFQHAGIRLVCPDDAEWPTQLADLGDAAPYALWLRGNADLRFSCLRSITITGSRAATAYGSYVAADLACSLAADGWAVISGGAFGIDAAAHRGALGANGATVVVLAGGVDVPYPAAHTELFNAIAYQGVIVSEWAPGKRVNRLRFQARRRVIAALATGTLVVEAGGQSGALDIAGHAQRLGRPLMAVPGPITSDLSAGCHHIIKEWNGTLVTSARDITARL